MVYRFLDIETYCDIDLKKYGTKNYIEHPSFEIILVGWKDLSPNFDYKNTEFLEVEYQEFDNIDLEFFKKGFRDPNITLVSHNAAFEVTAFEKVLGININWNKVICTMTRAYQMGLMGSLSGLSKMLDLKNGKLEGTALINYFSKPRKPTKLNLSTRNYPVDNPMKWDEYIKYNGYDVLAMIELWYKVLQHFKPIDFEDKLFYIDKKINDKGIKIDEIFLSSALNYISQHTLKNMNRLRELTGLENPNSNTQFLDWVKDFLLKYGISYHISSCDKESLIRISDFLEGYHYTTYPKDMILEVLKLKKGLNKTSLKKYNAAENLAHNGRLYDTLVFSGASSTGRWKGRGFQVQNLARNKLENIDQIREAYKYDTRPITDNLPYELSQLLRTLIAPEHGHSLIVSDYSAIEARVAAWISGEQWVLDTFRNGGDIYKATASKMFDEEYENVSKDMRQDGKVAVLAGGYGGGYRAYQIFAPDWDDDKAKFMVDLYRNSNTKIVKSWSKLNKAAKFCCERKAKFELKLSENSPTFQFRYYRGCMLIKLPSGRELVFPRARVEKDSYGYDNVTYEGVDCLTRKWVRLKTYGGKLLENITQAVARDILANAIYLLYTRNWDILFHVHDEIICQIKDEYIGDSTLKLYNDILCELPDWAAGLPMKAEGFFTKFYMKE